MIRSGDLPVCAPCAFSAAFVRIRALLCLPSALFFSDLWQQTPLHVRRDEDGYFDEVMSLNDVDQLAATGRSQHVADAAAGWAAVVRTASTDRAVGVGEVAHAHGALGRRCGGGH